MADANARIRRSPDGRESVVMYTNADWNHLREEHEIAYLRADICLGSPQSYSLEEKRQICEDMDASTKAIDAAMRADFWSLPAEARDRILDMLGASDCETRRWWEDLLGVHPSDLTQENQMMF